MDSIKAGRKTFKKHQDADRWLGSNGEELRCGRCGHVFFADDTPVEHHKRKGEITHDGIIACMNATG